MEDMWTLMPPDTEVISTTIKTTDKPRLLTLPGEIRNKIWRMLLTTRYAFKEPASEDDWKAHYELQPAILRVNRQIYNETRGILREDNMWIFLCIAMLKKPIHYIDETARLPFVSRSILIEPNEAGTCYMGKDSHALNMFLYPERSPLNYDRDYNFHTMIMGPESMPYLLQMLFALLYNHRSVLPPPKNALEIYIGYPTYFTRSRLQKEILEPISAAQGLRCFSIAGNVDEILAPSLRFEMGRTWQSGTELLELSEAYLEKGDAAAAARLTEAASFHFEIGSHFTFYAGLSCLSKYHTSAEKNHLRLRIRSMQDTFDVRWAKVLLKLRCYADAQRVATFVLGRVKQSPSPSIDETVELVLCCALASLGLGQTSRFRQTMRGLIQGTCDWGGLSTGFGWTVPARPIFPDNQSLIRRKEATLKEFDDLVAYCKEGEKCSLQRVDTGESLPDRKEIEFPVAEHWSAMAVRYKRRFEAWVHYKTISGSL